MIKINMGCGKRNFGKDWIHIDGGNYSHLDSHDITKIPYGDNSVDLIYASHVLEYFNREEAIAILKEWKRVLKPGGMLRLAVPNFKIIAELYISQGYDLESFLGPLYGEMNMRNSTIYHTTCYDYKSLKNLLISIEFCDVVYYDWKNTCHSNFDDHSQSYIPHMDKGNGTLISLNVECKK